MNTVLCPLEKEYRVIDFEGLRQNDEAAWQQFYESYDETFYRIARGYIPDPHDAEEMVGETFLRIYDRVCVEGRRPDDMDKLHAWLTGFCRNICRDRLRRIDRELSYLRNRPQETSDFDAFKADRSYFALMDCLEHLDPALRQVVEMFFLEDMQQQEIAEQLSINHTTIRTQVYRAKKELFNCMKNKGIAPDRSRS